MKAAKELFITCGQRSRQSRREREEDLEQAQQRNKNQQQALDDSSPADNMNNPPSNNDLIADDGNASVNEQQDHNGNKTGQETQDPADTRITTATAAGQNDDGDNDANHHDDIIATVTPEPNLNLNSNDPTVSVASSTATTSTAADADEHDDENHTGQNAIISPSMGRTDGNNNNNHATRQNHENETLSLLTTSLPGEAVESSEMDLTNNNNTNGRPYRNHPNHIRSSINGGRQSLTSQSSLQVISPQPRRATNDLSTMTIDKLQFHVLNNNHLYGRHQEVERMRAKLKDMMMNDGNDKTTTAADGATTITSPTDRQCILIRGFSGCGKTALAQSISRLLTEAEEESPPHNKGGLVVQGKFDLNRQAGDPYHGITEACSAICGAILKRQVQQRQDESQTKRHDDNDTENHNNPQNEDDDLGTKLRQQLGDTNLKLLTNMMPALKEVMASEPITLGTDDPSPVPAQASSAEDLKNRFTYSFLQFVQIVATQYFGPLILSLDDLQWADASSLDLLQHLLLTTSSNATNNNNNNDNTAPYKLMVIGTFRSNEVDETHIFHRVRDELCAKASDTSGEALFQMTEIEIGTLNERAVHNVVCDLLGYHHSSSSYNDNDKDDYNELLENDQDRKRTLDLVNVCMQKTQGNVFYLLQFLSMLHENKLLTFNYATTKWNWDVDTIRESTAASDNVVDLLQTKMTTRLDPETLDILRLAACLGSSFDKAMLRLVWEQLIRPKQNVERLDKSRDTLEEGIQVLTNEGYWILNATQSESGIVSSSPTYSWAHDKVHEAAATLLDGDTTFRRSVGELILKSSSDDDLDATIFIISNLMNGDCDLDEADFSEMVNQESHDFQLQMAQLNLKAAQKSVASSAFDSAAEYASLGIKWLPNNSWKDHYELALNLYNLGAKCFGYLGGVETMESYCNKVIQQDIPMEEKLDVYIALIDSIANRANFAKAKEIAADVLKHFDCRFPERSTVVGLKILKEIIRIKGTVKSRTVSDLQPMRDPTRVRLMKILDQLGLHCYLSKDERMPLIFFKSLKWTFKHGYSSHSPTAFATSAVILIGALNDLQSANHYGLLALELNGKLGTDITRARLYLTLYSFVFPWVRPLKDLLGPMLEAYDAGLRTGDTESGTWSIFHWIVLKMMVGSSLEGLEADALRYTKQMVELKRDMAAEFLTYIRQVFLNLLGKDNVGHPTNITGRALSEEAYGNHLKHPFHSAGIQAYHGMLLTYFGEHVKRADGIVAAGHDYLQKVMVASVKTMFDTFLACVSCFAAGTQTGKRIYAKLGEVLRGKIKKWADGGNPNVKHFEAFVDAEALAYHHGSKDSASVLKAFQLAIFLSTRGGYQHDAAFANERLAEYQLSVLGDENDAAFYLNKSIRHWREWGAIAKVEHLRRKYEKVLPDPVSDAIISFTGE